MPIHDISLTLSPTLPTWRGDPPLTLERISDQARGDDATVTRMAGAVHIGTHVDAPLHFVAAGDSVDTLDLEALIGPAFVVDATHVDTIGEQELEALEIPPGVQRLLVKTRNSKLWARGETAFQTDYVAIDASGAEWLVERCIRLVGVDYLSVAPFDAPVPTHVTLLQAGVIPVEGLNLSGIDPGAYELICLPLKIAACDGAPARAVLIK